MKLEFSERMLDKRERQRGPQKRRAVGDDEKLSQATTSDRAKKRKRKQQSEPKTKQQQELSAHFEANQTAASLLQRLTGTCEIETSQLRQTASQQNKENWIIIDTATTCSNKLTAAQQQQQGELGARIKQITRLGRTLRRRTLTTTRRTLANTLSRGTYSGNHLMGLLQLALLSLALAAGAASGRREAPVAQQADSLQLLAESDKQLHLLRSANVELSRRSERLQRDSPAPDGGQQQQQQQPTCGYPGSPAHASVIFNTTHVVAGTAASYSCDNGYELLGPPRRLCQANGTWAPVGIPFCVLNVGLGKAAMQSSTAGHGSAQKAVDGSTSPYFQASTCTMTDVEHNPWWYVNLLEPYLVQIVRIDFGTACCANRQKATIAVRVGNNRPDLGNNPLCNRYHGFIEEGKPLFLPCTRPAPGAFVSIHLESPSGSSLSICETFIYTDHALSIEQCPSFRDQPLGSTATYNGKCYLFHNNQALNFEGARKYCESRGGTLVDETSPALQGFLSWELYRRHRNDQLMGQYWLGAVKDQRNPQNWKWISGKDVQISFWNSLGTQGNCSRFDGSKGWLWSDTDCSAALNFICQYRPLSCGKPEKPTNSTLITKNIDNGTVIEYQCAPGNLLMGPKSRACLPTGFFSEFAPKCKYLDCQFPAMIPNGDYKLLNGTTSYQSVVTYFCNDGYQIYGKATLACDVDERWNGPPPRCEPLLCPAPVPPSNGYVTVTSNITVPGTQATYDCRPGYELVGDRLLTCSSSGSWDNNFPYCREKRSVMPHLLQLGSSPATPTLSSGSRQQQQQLGAAQGTPTKPTGTVQFPPSSPFSPNRIGATSSTSAPPQTPMSTPSSQAQPSTSSPASLNGLAGQFVQNSQASAPATPSEVSQQPPAEPQQSRRPSPASAPTPELAPLPASEPGQPQVSSAVQAAQPAAVLSSTQQTQQRFRPQTPGVSSAPSLASSTSSSNQQAFTSSTPTLVVSPSSATNSRHPATGSTTPGKFSFMGSGQQQQPATLSHVTYDSTPLATTNSISVHQQQQHSVSSVVASSAPSATSASTTMTSAPVQHHSSAGVQSVQQNVLASFSTPTRSQNTLASARYSLDGIIAVAIFGGFIFLGAIITIIVIIIRRRKSSHSSTIDAQTISTYDSNGEHNGLYRNYQQAWENLRFATPSSQPKMSGSAGLITAHVNGGPSVSMKNFATPSVAMVQHAHQMHQLHGQHNLAMGGSTSSSQGSSLAGCAGAGPLGGTGADPLLRGHHAHSLAHHHQQQQHLAARRRGGHSDDDDDDDYGDDGLDAGEHGVLASDEANYRVEHQAGEGFRDSNELTINADTAIVNGGGQAAARRRIYSTNSIGRTMAAQRLSSNLSVAGGDQHQRHHHHHHHQQARHASGGSGQHQRLVSSSTTPSTSTRSSRASPPSDDQSLDQLAYGNGWHATGSQSQANHHHQQQQDNSSSNSHSAGSGASILGGGRANLRYN